MDREQLGRRVREVWIAWAREQPNPKPSWLVPWEGLSEPDKEVDRRIGAAIWCDAMAQMGVMDDLRQLAVRVETQHRPVGVQMGGGDTCGVCHRRYPCDAAVLAQAVQRVLAPDRTIRTPKTAPAPRD